MTVTGWGGQPLVDVSNHLLAVNRIHHLFACTSAGNYEPILCRYNDNDAADVDKEAFFCVTPMGKLIQGTSGVLGNPFNVSEGVFFLLLVPRIGVVVTQPPSISCVTK